MSVLFRLEYDISKCTISTGDFEKKIIIEFVFLLRKSITVVWDFDWNIFDVISVSFRLENGFNK